MESVTQVPQIFNHGTQNEYFRVEILFINGRSISSLVMKCVKDLVDYVKLLSSDETEEDLEHARLSAEAGRQVIDDLFSHQDGLKSLDDAEGFLESKSLLPADSEDISETAFESLCKEIQDRAVSEGIDLDTRSMFLTAGNVGELHAKTMRFSERGAFASIVSSIRTKFYSPLLAMGIEVADLPGLTDTNLHLRKTSLAYSINCPKAIFVADLLRCMTTPDLEKSLRGIIKMKGAENVCLVLRGKEVCNASFEIQWIKILTRYRMLRRPNRNGPRKRSLRSTPWRSCQRLRRVNKLQLRLRGLSARFATTESRSETASSQIIFTKRGFKTRTMLERSVSSPWPTNVMRSTCAVLPTLSCLGTRLALRNFGLTCVRRPVETAFAHSHATLPSALPRCVVSLSGPMDPRCLLAMLRWLSSLNTHAGAPMDISKSCSRPPKTTARLCSRSITQSGLVTLLRPSWVGPLSMPQEPRVCSFDRAAVTTQS